MLPAIAARGRKRCSAGTLSRQSSPSGNRAWHSGCRRREPSRGDSLRRARRWSCSSQGCSSWRCPSAPARCRAQDRFDRAAPCRPCPKRARRASLAGPGNSPASSFANCRNTCLARPAKPAWHRPEEPSRPVRARLSDRKRHCCVSPRSRSPAIGPGCRCRSASYRLRNRPGPSSRAECPAS